MYFVDKKLTVLFTRFIKSLFVGLLFFVCMPLHADEELNLDSITDENFVIASLLIYDQDTAPVSYLGHACFRMRCPMYGLDYCFGYTSEAKDNEELHMIMGDLHMGMIRWTTEECLKTNREARRGVTEYVLNLPVKAKQNLWRILDEQVERGFELLFDYEKRGCAHSSLGFIRESLDTMQMHTEWPEKLVGTTRRQAFHRCVDMDTWTASLIGFIFSGSGNLPALPYENAIMPQELVDVLRASTVAGKPVISGEGVRLVEGKKLTSFWFTPNMAAIVLLILTIICSIWQKPYMTYVLLGIQTVLGLLLCYLVFFADLPFTEWNLLMLPLNPLPLLLWKWHKMWQVSYAFIILLWIIFMIIVPYPQTESYMIILSCAICVSYIDINKIGGRILIELKR